MTGGLTDSSRRLDTTEVYAGTAWREVGRLPSPRSELAGATVRGALYMLGGLDGPTGLETSLKAEVLVWAPSTESWGLAGSMTRRRASLAVTAVPDTFISHYCGD